MWQLNVLYNPGLDFNLSKHVIGTISEIWMGFLGLNDNISSMLDLC
jgi:hypothetical protein